METREGVGGKRTRVGAETLEQAAKGKGLEDGEWFGSWSRSGLPSCLRHGRRDWGIGAAGARGGDDG